MQALAERGVPVETWVEGLPLEVEDLTTPGATIPWDVFVPLIDRASEASGGPEELEALALKIAHSPASVGRRALRLAAGPIELYKLILLWGRSLEFEDVTVRVEDLPGGRLRVTSEIREHLPGSIAFWHAVRGSLRGVPRLMGLPEARVQGEITPHRAVFVITPPPSATLASRVRGALRGLVSSRPLVEELARQQEELRASYAELRAAHTALQRQSDALRESEARYRALIENTADTVAVSDMRGRFVFVNQGVIGLTGYHPEEWVGQLGHQFIHPDDLPMLSSALPQLEGDGVEVPLEFRLLCRDGEARWVEGRAKRFCSAEGEDRAVLVIRDIGDRKRAEAERQSYAAKLEREVARRTRELEQVNRQLRALQTRLINAERIGAAGELAGRVAHSINNPLAALIGNLELMIESTGDDGLERLLQLAKRIEAVVQRTLELFRQGALDLEPENPGKIVLEVARELRERGVRPKLEIETKIPGGLPLILIDRTLLVSALVGIAENGVDAMAGGGTLWLEVGALPGLGVIRFTVADSGPGIAPELQGKVFEPFFTTKPAGTGLGLAIAQGIVRGHEGRIVFAQRPGGGTIATVELPYLAAPLG